MTSFSCSGCNQLIVDQFLLKADGKHWHEECLKCDCCRVHLGEIGCVLYSKGGLTLCKNDYLKLFGKNGHCSKCSRDIQAHELVMRVKSLVFHLECFHCSRCNKEFCIGDEFRVIENNVLCIEDYLLNNQPNLSTQTKIETEIRKTF